MTSAKKIFSAPLRKLSLHYSFYIFLEKSADFVQKFLLTTDHIPTRCHKPYFLISLEVCFLSELSLITPL